MKFLENMTKSLHVIVQKLFLLFNFTYLTVKWSNSSDNCVPPSWKRMTTEKPIVPDQKFAYK